MLCSQDRTMEYKMLVGTCDQDDVFYEHHTQKIFLKFHAKGANRHLSDEQNEERINFLLKRLRLEGRRNTKVAKLSGGEKKRLILISELMTDKKIIFLDEPTSGLDSHLALDLISFLKEITVEKNLMMFVTIHQPSPTIVRMFDDFTFLAWGRVLYHGEYVKCEEYFKENGFIKP
ncbi:ATP-binding Cassette (ABC) Superfamily [Tubulinosema ratisbonensis]|uniref:ATP-binding Cassette (ABC) Superfamily n=1 Tax=Tubulinosema ratisbonensis TaxID=291195 RepID=A0A437AMP5_9MICR|nr:ATP-binding Cassette (ABC) Superfamily [Tubulinosema ratisbonensis]